MEGVRLITHLNIEFWERVTSGGTVHNDMCLPVLILGLLQPLVPSRGLSGSFHSRGLTGFAHGSPGDPRDLTDIPSRQRHRVPFYKGEDAFPQFETRGIFIPPQSGLLVSQTFQSLAN